jgi:hypothetical protein
MTKRSTVPEPLSPEDTRHASARARHEVADLAALAALPGVARLRSVVIAVGRREKCGARCKQTGMPCKAPPVWDHAAARPRNGRCRMHGGLSSGAKTPEGKARQRAARGLALQKKKDNP